MGRTYSVAAHGVTTGLSDGAQTDTQTAASFDRYRLSPAGRSAGQHVALPRLTFSMYCVIQDTQK